MLTKKEVIEMIYRPIAMPEDLLSQIVAEAMRYNNEELTERFNKSTKLTLSHLGGNLFTIKY